MLVLSRTEGQRVVIRSATGEIIAKVLVTRIQRGKVGLAFVADKSTDINREEIDAKKYGEPVAA